MQLTTQEELKLTSGTIHTGLQVRLAMTLSVLKRRLEHFIAFKLHFSFVQSTFFIQEFHSFTFTCCSYFIFITFALKQQNNEVEIIPLEHNSTRHDSAQD